MGADFVSATLEIPKKYTEKYGLTPGSIQSFIDNLYRFVENTLNLEEDYSAFTSIDGEDLDKHSLLLAIDDFKTMDHREYSILYLHGGFVYVTGGMSWGDYPTDAFRTICIIHEIAWCMKHKYKMS